MWLLGREWRGGFPRYHRHQRQVRIAVRAWLRCGRVEGAYFVPDRNWRRLLRYVVALGPIQAWWKVRSRLQERDRNDKFVACGVGVVVAAPDGSELMPGTRVVFVAPFHPRCVSEVCLVVDLVRAFPDTPDVGDEGALLEGELSLEGELPREGERPLESDLQGDLAGWSDFSGLPAPAASVDATAKRAVAALRRREFREGLVRRDCPSESVGRGQTLPAASPRPSAVLFGYGHYAKNVVLPRVYGHLDVRAVHEIDPAQLGPAAGHRTALSTSAWPSADDRHDVYLVCGFHHTHAPIAAQALLGGAAVVMEKPIATTDEQLRDLMAALDGAGRLFVAFQRRYYRFNEYLRTDLQLGVDIPVSCRALVYEPPLPPRHWYRWPVSRSRVVQNGCHWIDHFLYLNGFAEPTRVAADIRSNGDVTVTIDLVNDASLILVITEIGSPRMGVREHVEYRVGRRTATITDARRYRAESASRVLRRSRTSVREPYDRMYDRIARAIVTDAAGDDPDSVRVSASVTLAADRQLAAR